MSDPKQKLTETEIREAGLDDWRLMGKHIEATFATKDFATGLAFVDQIGHAAEAADHHPDITLTYPSVGVTLCSHDVDGITSRDVDLARKVSEFAKDLDVQASHAAN